MADGPQAVILAAGQGRRMQSATPKVLHPLGGRPLILHVIEAARAVTPTLPVVVVNPGQPQVASKVVMVTRAPLASEPECQAILPFHFGLSRSS